MSGEPLSDKDFMDILKKIKKSKHFIPAENFDKTEEEIFEGDGQ